MEDRDKKIAELTKKLMEGGWSSVYSFVDNHVEDWELDDEDDEDEDKNL